MLFSTTHNEIENQIDVFLENVKKNGSTVGILVPSEALKKLPGGQCDRIRHRESPSEGSQLTLNSEDSETMTDYTSHTFPLTSSDSPVDTCSVNEMAGINNDTMDDGNCPVTVEEVAELLHAKHAIITGGKSKDGCPLITFPDNSAFSNLSDEDYKRLMVYLTSIPSTNCRLQEADFGFVLVVDRRNDTWNGVKAVLWKIGSYFPGLVQAVYVVRPSSFFQKAISEVRNKLFKEDFKFHLVVCNNVEELHSHIDARQLTRDLEGCISYEHTQWIEERSAIEKFSQHTRDISTRLRGFTSRLQESELPNDVQSTKELLHALKKEYDDLKDELCTTSDNGEALLKLLRHPCTRTQTAISTCASSTDVCPDSKLINVTTIERLLVQLEETQRVFENFWLAHANKLQQCLELRMFEHSFRDLHSNLNENFKLLNDMREMGDSVARVDALLRETSSFVDRCEDDLDKAKQLRRIGEQLIDSNHYAIDSIQPKCKELQRFCEDFNERLSKRMESLQKYRDLQERVECANKWCARGVDLLAGPQLERCTSPESALEEVEAFLQSSSEFKLDNPREFRNYFKDMITPETTALVQQVLKRIEDVQVMCEKKKTSLQKMSARSSRPVQPVVPEPAIPFGNYSNAPTSGGCQHSSVSQSLSSGGESVENPGDQVLDSNGEAPAPRKFARKARTLPKLRPGFREPNPLQPMNETLDYEVLIRQQKHIITELLDTERVYVAELKSILQGYKEEMKSQHAKDIIPENLLGREGILFGNMDIIHNFHKDIFLRDLLNCINTPELIGLCFIQRKDSFHNLYTDYCQNKPKSEALRNNNGGDQLQFFKECQSKLGHKLPLSAYLLKPVQRITKYQLLLKDLLKYTTNCQGMEELQEAVDCMLDVLKYVNDSMHQVAITGFPGVLSAMGRLLMQCSFSVWSVRKIERLKDLRLNPMQRHLFLYDRAVIFCKKSGKHDDRATYCFKHCLMMSQVGLTESVKGCKSADSRKFELWTPGRKEVYVLQAATMDIKQAWIKEIKGVLMDQFTNIKVEIVRQHSEKFQTISSQLGKKPVIGSGDSITKKSHRRSWDSADYVRPQNPEDWPCGARPSKRKESFNLSRLVERMQSVRPRSKSMSSRQGLHPGQQSPAVTRYSSQELAHQDPDFALDYDEAWSDPEGFSSSESDDTFGLAESGYEEDGQLTQLVALADYDAVDAHEVTLLEGQVVELLKTGCAGWWFVHILGTDCSGWAPASFLKLNTK